MKPNGSLTTYLRKLEQGLKAENVSVPCGGCTACCSDPGFEVDVSEEESKKYKSSRREHGRWLLDRQETGECVYLIDKKCTVYDDRPRTCRVYDCRYHLFGSPLADNCKQVKAAVAEWDLFHLNTMEDKVASVAIMTMIIAMQQVNPSMTGLAYAILQWRKFYDKAYEAVQRLERS